MNDSDLSKALADSLTLTLPHTTSPKSGSIAISSGGAVYPAGVVESETHLLTIPSEVAALVRALQAGDTQITEVRTVVTDTNAPRSPLAVNVLIDHVARTGVPLRYGIYDEAGICIFESPDVRQLLPWYQSPGTVIPSRIRTEPDGGKERLSESSGLSLEMQLRKWAIAGRDRNFPTRDGASGYGASVLTASGDIYYGGQYSTFDHRLGVHAEMGVLLCVLMDGVRDITHIGIASSKFPDTPCSPCGCCRQFMNEMSRAYGFSPTLCLFASENEEYLSFTIEELLPAQWSNKK